jgi:RNA polymerase sigma factor (TIGR02999 family)
MPPAKDITQLLVDWRNGDAAALDALFPLVYDELRRLAEGYMRRERPDHTLQATALVHEAYLRLVGLDVPWESRLHFFAVAAQVMRRILVDHARQYQYAKRGGGARQLSLDEAVDFSIERAADVVALDDALSSLAVLDPQKVKIVELQYFGGLTYEEMGQLLGLSRATVHRELQMAKAWLYREIRNDERRTMNDE